MTTLYDTIGITATVEQMEKYWLWEYFPRVMERGTGDIAKVRQAR